MNVNQKFFNAFKKAMFTATAVIALASCSQDEEIVAPAITNDVTTEAAAVNTSELLISSLTVTGTNTAFANAKDCKACSYIVSANEQMIDGKELGFKPGNIICLNAKVKYGNLEFVNIDGTTENPIIIATVGAISKREIADNASSTNPY